MKYSILVCCIFSVVLAIGTASAEIYKYRDAQGVIRYTYDLGEVPENQRPGMKSYEEVSSTTEVDSGDQAEIGTGGDDKGSPSEDPSPIVDDQKIEKLNQKKKELDQEFAGLMEEKYKLLKEKERLGTLAGRDANAVAAYDTKVKELNRKIADYQKRQEAFQTEAEAVKKAVEKSESP